MKKWDAEEIDAVLDKYLARSMRVGKLSTAGTSHHALQTGLPR